MILTSGPPSFLTNFSRLLQIYSVHVSRGNLFGKRITQACVLKVDGPIGIGIGITMATNRQMADRMKQLVNNQAMDSWDKCWVEGVTPWDIGHVTPIISLLVKDDLLPQGRALVPGCGAGYDVVALANPNRYVVGVDISETAIKQAQELTASAPNAEHFQFLKDDFFTWSPSELFDFIFDYTFFCAIEPQMRPAWAKRIAELLKPDGELLTLMFPVSDHEGGPPYAVSVSKYEEVLQPYDFEPFSIENNEMAIGKRKGREILARWKRKGNHRSLL